MTDVLFISFILIILIENSFAPLLPRTMGFFSLAAWAPGDTICLTEALSRVDAFLTHGHEFHH